MGSQDSPWLILIGCLAGINATNHPQALGQHPCLTRVHQVYEAQILVFQREICFLNPNIDVKAMKTSTINYISLSTTKTTRTLPANQVHLPMFIIFHSSISMFKIKNIETNSCCSIIPRLPCIFAKTLKVATTAIGGSSTGCRSRLRISPSARRCKRRTLAP